MCRSDAGAAMPSNTLTARGRFFEEFTAGQRYTTPGRTVTESDIVTFAGLTGDFNSIHTDAVYAKASSFGERVAHGMLGISFAVGLAVRTGVLEGTVSPSVRSKSGNSHSRFTLATRSISRLRSPRP